MWVITALLSALFAGITAILAKAGMKQMESNLGTALRTIVVLVFAWLMVFVKGSQNMLAGIDGRALLFLVLSGLATGASWLCYFKALQLGDVNKVAPIDKSSTVLGMLLAFLFLGEELTLLKIFCMLLIGGGASLMVIKKKAVKVAAKEGRAEGMTCDLTPKATRVSWVVYAILSAFFASLTSILGKVGITGIESNLGTAIRTVVVLLMAWVVVFVTGAHKHIKNIGGNKLVFLVLSGITTGMSWLCYYRALQEGPASVVIPIDSVSIQMATRRRP